MAGYKIFDGRKRGKLESLEIPEGNCNIMREQKGYDYSEHLRFWTVHCSNDADSDTQPKHNPDTNLSKHQCSIVDTRMIGGVS